MIHRRLIALCFAWIAVLGGCSTATTPHASDGASGRRATATAGRRRPGARRRRPVAASRPWRR